MKISSTLLIAVTAALAFSCKKDHHAPPADKQSLTANLGTNPYLSTIFQATTSGNYAIRANGEFEIPAWEINGHDSTLLELTFPDTLSLNTPFLDSTGNLFSIQLLFNTPANRLDSYRNYYFRSPNNVVTITALDLTAHKVAGTFSGTVYKPTRDSILISNGSFNLTYKSYP